MRISALVLLGLITGCHHVAHVADLGAFDEGVAIDLLPGVDASEVDATVDAANDAATLSMPPMAAIAAGCTKQVFFDDFDDLSSIDLDDTRVAGFKWYVHDTASGTTTPKANLTLVKLGTTTALRFDPKGAAVQGATRNMQNDPVSTSFSTQGGKCLYIEGRLAMGLADKTAPSWPAFWMNPAKHIQSIALPWAGDTVDTGYEHYVEMDIMELNPGYSLNARATLIDWYGDYNKAAQACQQKSYCKMQDSQGLGPDVAGTYDSTDAKPVFHRYGALWIPSVPNGSTQTQGAMHWYIDGVELGHAVTWTGPPSTTVFEPAKPWEFSVLDSLDMSLIMNNGGGAFMDVDYAAIWQTP